MLLLNFFISLISCGVNNKVMQRYVRQAEIPSFEIHCKELVSSLLQCAALGRVSKDVRFFFSKEDSLCRWNCVLLYNRSGILGNEWYHYGKFYENFIRIIGILYALKQLRIFCEKRNVMKFIFYIFSNLTILVPQLSNFSLIKKNQRNT